MTLSIVYSFDEQTQKISEDMMDYQKRYDLCRSFTTIFLECNSLTRIFVEVWNNEEKLDKDKTMVRLCRECIERLNSDFDKSETSPEALFLLHRLQRHYFSRFMKEDIINHGDLQFEEPENGNVHIHPSSIIITEECYQRLIQHSHEYGIEAFFDETMYRQIDFYERYKKRS